MDLRDTVISVFIACSLTELDKVPRIKVPSGRKHTQLKGSKRAWNRGPVKFHSATKHLLPDLSRVTLFGRHPLLDKIRDCRGVGVHLFVATIFAQLFICTMTFPSTTPIAYRMFYTLIPSLDLTD